MNRLISSDILIKIIIILMILGNNTTVQKQNITQTINSAESSELLSDLTKIYTNALESREGKIAVYGLPAFARR